MDAIFAASAGGPAVGAAAGHVAACRPAPSAQRPPAPPRGFTLIEMLTVIVIIGILAGMITGAVIMARTRARVVAISLEIEDLERALITYKQERGSFPPDFAGLSNPAIRDQARQAVIRHFSNAFPRFPLSGDLNTQWDTLKGKFALYGMNIENMDPAAALVFWLGGLPDGADSTRLIGFSANPRDPFEQSGSRLPMLFEFDPGRLRFEDGVLRYYPKTGGATTAPYVYFKGGAHGYDSHPGFASSAHPEWGSTGPCLDTRVLLDTTGTTFDWAQRDSFQIRAAGLDGKFGAGVLFPAGTDYDEYTFDDQTNFSEGTLQDQM